MTTIKNQKTKNLKKEFKNVVEKNNSDKKYQRKISITKAMYKFFDENGGIKNLDNLKYEDCLKLALKIKKDSKFNKYHFSWYKNQYRQLMS